MAVFLKKSCTVSKKERKKRLDLARQCNIQDGSQSQQHVALSAPAAFILSAW